jgi:tryptophan 2,3-dioxygenase
MLGGGAVGTQGTPVDVLQRLLHSRLYPELWEVRNELTTLSDLQPVSLSPDKHS